MIETLGAKELFSGFKVGESIYKSLKKDAPEDLKIYEMVYRRAIGSLDKKYEAVEISRLFNNQEIKDVFLKVVFSNEDLNLELINQHVLIDSLPPLLLPELIQTIKEESKKTPLVKYLNTAEQTMFLDSIEGTLCELKEILLRKINVRNFYEKYKENAKREYSRIKFFGIKLPTAGNRPTENKLESLFVVPNFIEYDKDNASPIELKKVINYGRLVILGKPGAGKSTLVKHLILEELRVEETIPLRIGLKDYENYLLSHHDKNLLDFIIDDLNMRFGTSGLSRDNIIDVFTNETFSFYFDGLDEVFSELRRSKIRDDIENFSQNFSNNNIVVTSRIVGYKDSPFDTSAFSIFMINDFNSDQINSYVHKWFNIDIQDDTIRDEYFHKFEVERQSIGNDLLSNPLMLSIILILFTRGFSIPSSRLAIYQSCTETLIDKWEDHKEINIDIPKKTQAIAHLAYWQYENTPNDEAVIREMTKFYETFKDDFSYEEAEKNAYEFLEYLHKRSIYFNNIFVHKTFLEYYAARYIFTKYEKKGQIEKRNSLIKEYIENSYWFVVLELLIAMIDKDQADHEVMEELISEHTKNGTSEVYAFFLKNFRNIENIGKKFRQNILRECFLKCLQEASSHYQDTISVSTCSKGITDLHTSFNYLNAEDIKYIESLVPEYISDYEFEIAAFFVEIENFDSNEGFNKLAEFVSSKSYAAQLLFNIKDPNAYTNWKEHFPLQMMDTYFSFVYDAKPSPYTLSEMILSNLVDCYEDQDIDSLIEILDAIEESKMHIYEIPVDNINIIPLYSLIDMLEYVGSKEEESFFLYLIYRIARNRGATYLTAFLDLPNEYRNILSQFYEDNFDFGSAKEFYDCYKDASSVGLW